MTPLRDRPDYVEALQKAMLDGPRRPYHSPAMSLRFLFWLIMLLILIFALFTNWGRFGMALAMPALQYVLFAIVGWKVFGPPFRNE